MDTFGVVRTMSKTTNTSVQSRDFVSMTNSEMRTGEKRNTGLSNADPEERGIRRKRDWNHGQIWCGGNDKQRRKHTRPVEMPCDYDKFRDANRRE